MSVWSNLFTMEMPFAFSFWGVGFSRSWLFGDQYEKKRLTVFVQHFRKTWLLQRMTLIALLVSEPAGAMYQEMYQKELLHSLAMQQWTNGETGYGVMNEDNQLASLQFDGGAHSINLLRAPMLSDRWNSGPPSTYPEPGRPMLDDTLPSLAPAPEKDKIVVMGLEAFKRQFPNLHWAITAEDGKLLDGVERFKEDLITYRALHGMEVFFKELRSQKSGDARAFGRQLFTTMASRMLSTANSRSMFAKLLEKLWHLHKTSSKKSGLSKMYEQSDTLYSGSNPDPFVTVVQQLLQERGSDMLDLLLPDMPEKLTNFAAEFPVSYSIARLVHDQNQKYWWFKHYKTRELTTSMTQVFAEGVESTLPTRGTKWPSLKRVLKQYLFEVVELPVTMDEELLVNSLFHALLRQRFMLYTISHPFTPGKQAACTESGRHYETILETAGELNPSESDDAITRILTALNKQAACYDFNTIARAFFMLLEAPLGIFPLDKTISRWTSKKKDIYPLFQWLSDIPTGDIEKNYTDLLLKDWVLEEGMTASFPLPDVDPRYKQNNNLERRVKEMSTLLKVPSPEDSALQFVSLISENLQKQGHSTGMKGISDVQSITDDEVDEAMMAQVYKLLPQFHISHK